MLISFEDLENIEVLFKYKKEIEESCIMIRPWNKTHKLLLDKFNILDENDKSVYSCIKAFFYEMKKIKNILLSEDIIFSEQNKEKACVIQGVEKLVKPVHYVLKNIFKIKMNLKILRVEEVLDHAPPTGGHYVITEIILKKDDNILNYMNYVEYVSECFFESFKRHEKGNMSLHSLENTHCKGFLLQDIEDAKNVKLKLITEPLLLSKEKINELLTSLQKKKKDENCVHLELKNVEFVCRRYVTCQNVTDKSCMVCRPLWFVEDFNVVIQSITHSSKNV